MLLKVTFSEDEMAALDAARGQVPRATYVRALVRSATAVREAPVRGPVVRERSLDNESDFQAAPPRRTLREQLDEDPGTPLPPRVPVRGGRR